MPLDFAPTETPARPFQFKPVLLLNADFRPLCSFPLSTRSAERIIGYIFQEKVDVVAEYDEWIHSPSVKMRMPSVVALKEYVKQPDTVAFTRFYLFMRDKFKCQYCDVDCSHDPTDLTFDHIIPRSQGGRSNWLNIVAACKPCNLKKGSKLPHEAGMFPRQKPYVPTRWDLMRIGKNLNRRDTLHETWIDYLYWDVELESEEGVTLATAPKIEIITPTIHRRPTKSNTLANLNR